MPDWLFDAATRVIKEPPGSGDTVFNVKRDIYSAWKRWVINGEGSQVAEAFVPEGGTPIGSTGRFTGGAIVMTNGWKLQAADHSHQVTLQGNLSSDDDILSIANPVGDSTIVAFAAAEAQGIATGGGSGGGSLTQAQFNGFMANLPQATKDDFKATTTALDQTTFNDLMDNVPTAIQDEYKGSGGSGGGGLTTEQDSMLRRIWRGLGFYDDA